MFYNQHVYPRTFSFISATKPHSFMQGIFHIQKNEWWHCWEGGLNWNPARGHVQGSQYCPTVPGGLDPAGESGPSQIIAGSRCLKGVQWRVPCQVVSNSPQSSSGTYTCLGSRDRIAAPVREVGESRVGTASLCFSLTSCRCYVAVESICNVLTVVI